MLDRKNQKLLELEVRLVKDRITNRIRKEYPGIDQDLLEYLVHETMVNPTDITDIPEVSRDHLNLIVDTELLLEDLNDEESEELEFSENLIIDKKPQVKKSGARKVICKTTGMAFDSMKQAAEYYGLKSATGISKCCKGTQKTSGSYCGKKLEWQFA